MNFRKETRSKVKLDSRVCNWNKLVDWNDIKERSSFQLEDLYGQIFKYITCILSESRLLTPM